MPRGRTYVGGTCSVSGGGGGGGGRGGGVGMRGRPVAGMLAKMGGELSGGGGGGGGGRGGGAGRPGGMEPVLFICTPGEDSAGLRLGLGTVRP